MAVPPRGLRQSVVAQMATSLMLGVTLLSCSLPILVLPDDPVVDRTRPVNIDAITLAPDRRSGRIDFVGGPEFDLDDPCSVAYVADINVVGEELQVAVYPTRHPRSGPEGAVCDLIGHGRSIVFELREPFEGNIVRDLAGQLFFLEAPDGLVEIRGLPEGWVLVHEESLLESPTGRWSRTYAPAPDSGIQGGSVELIQAFDAPASVGGGETVSHVVVNHEQATLFLHQPTGSMVLVWDIAADGIALVGNLANFSQAEFLQLAESIVPPGE